MTRYSYNRQVDPPAPFLYLALASPDHPAWLERVPMLVDTGADITTLPRKLVAELRLLQFSEVLVSGFDESPRLCDTYLVKLRINEWQIGDAEVVLEDDSYGLLGRDILNQCLITLDGPGLKLMIQYPA